MQLNGKSECIYVYGVRTMTDKSKFLMEPCVAFQIEKNAVVLHIPNRNLAILITANFQFAQQIIQEQN